MNETIAAIATAHGQGGIAIIRISGPSSLPILQSCFQPLTPNAIFHPWQMLYGHVLDAESHPIDEALAVYMPGPHSYTRENVAEIHCHGGDVIAHLVLSRILQLGASPAGPGEFTKRAFLNGRIDLTRAEAVMQLIGANSAAAARASIRQLDGGVSGFIRTLSDKLLSLLALIEASTDFPDEVDEEATLPEIADSIRSLLSELRHRCDPRSARLLRDGASIVLAGRPNVGKSSLMNALLNQDRAIVTSVPGTTRDVLTERISINGVLAELSDTAGQRETSDPVERIGVDRARSAMDRADIILIVLDASSPLDESDRALLTSADDRALILLNKTDLLSLTTPSDVQSLTACELIQLSAATGEGVESLLTALSARISQNFSEDSLTVERHIALAQRACAALESALASISGGYPLDVISLDLREALAQLSSITETDPTESLLTEIFSTFCVGK